MTRSRTLLAVLVFALVAAIAAPAGAARSQDPRAARDAARARKAKLAAELNLLKASESQLLGAAKVLNDQVLAEAARVDAARQAVGAANAELAEANRSLTETKAALRKLGHIVTERAVASYMSPRSADPGGAGTTDLAAAARKGALLDAVAASDADLLDQLTAAQEDYKADLAAATAARANAQARRSQTEASLAALEKARGNQRRAASAVSTRQREVLREIDAQSKADSALSRIIAERARPSTAGGTVRSVRGCLWPVAGRVTSEYGRRWGRLHAGIDISAPNGTIIRAAKSGTVILSGRQSGYGNVVIIDHGGGLTTLYAHQSRRAASDGQSVTQGQVIGYVGSTGRSTGNHVHFETRYSGGARNPRGCLG